MPRRTRAWLPWALLATTAGVVLLAIATLHSVQYWGIDGDHFVGAGGGCWFVGKDPVIASLGTVWLPNQQPEWWFAFHSFANDWWLQVPIWAVALPMAAWTALAFRSARRRARPGGCPACGYDRTGLAPEAVCPECGASAAPTR
jgi:hypothetical protein